MEPGLLSSYAQISDQRFDLKLENGKPESRQIQNQKIWCQ